MAILDSVEIENFRCFRRPVAMALAGATYLVGVNDSGKTSVLSALRCFFDSNAYDPAFLNQAERAARRKAFNRTRIAVTFDLSALPNGRRRLRLIEAYGKKIKIDKFFTTPEISRVVAVEYAAKPARAKTAKPVPFDDLEKDVRDLLNGVSLSYIHPQEGEKLLAEAQEKLKTRLLTNWGRHATISNSLKKLEERWNDLRATADSYLSSALTESLQGTWPGSKISIALPEKIKDVIGVSDIVFSGATGLPEVSLTGHGTGAQSTILYHTHYLLDSDRTLHQGMYFPVWLLEEPESFLHADIALKLGSLLNSDEWLGRIQMIVSTHSPLILATTKAQEADVNWAVIENHGIKRVAPVARWKLEEVRELGVLMGDSNFEAYFYGSRLGDTLYLEDSRDLTRAKFVEAGFALGPVLKGASDVGKYLEVIGNLKGVVGGRSFFIVDNDAGKSHLKQHLAAASTVKELDGFTLLRVSASAFIILLPPGFAVEDLFAEFASVVAECQEALFVDGRGLATSVPGDLTRAHAALRGRNPANEVAARLFLRSQQDIKDVFWRKVESENLTISSQNRSVIEKLIAAAA